MHTWSSKHVAIHIFNVFLTKCRTGWLTSLAQGMRPSCLLPPQKSFLWGKVPQLSRTKRRWRTWDSWNWCFGPVLKVSGESQGQPSGPYSRKSQDSKESKQRMLRIIIMKDTIKIHIQFTIETNMIISRTIKTPVQCSVSSECLISTKKVSFTPLSFILPLGLDYQPL